MSFPFLDGNKFWAPRLGRPFYYFSALAAPVGARGRHSQRIRAGLARDSQAVAPSIVFPTGQVQDSGSTLQFPMRAEKAPTARPGWPADSYISYQGPAGLASALPGPLAGLHINGEALPANSTSDAARPARSTRSTASAARGHPEAPEATGRPQARGLRPEAAGGAVSYLFIPQLSNFPAEIYQSASFWPTRH